MTDFIAFISWFIAYAIFTTFPVVVLCCILYFFGPASHWTERRSGRPPRHRRP